jgi:peptidyl-prolyl cis-trans isomerase SurA
MKKFFSITSIILICLAFTQKIYSKENKIILKINNEIITTIDIYTEIRYLSEINKDFSNLDYESKINVAKKSLVREKIKNIELRRLLDEIKIEKKILDNLSISYFKRLGINSVEDFNNFFKINKINPDLVRKKITSEVLWNQLIFNKYKDKIKINKEEIKKKIKNRKQKEYNLREILFELEDKEKLKDKYELIKNYINSKSFSEAVLKFSISKTINNKGKIGWVKETVLNKKIIKNLNEISIGQISKPIVLPGGYLILKIDDIKEINIEYDIENEMNLIVKKKTNEQLNQYSNIYFNKIKKNIKINEL